MGKEIEKTHSATANGCGEEKNAESRRDDGTGWRELWCPEKELGGQGDRDGVPREDQLCFLLSWELAPAFSF